MKNWIKQNWPILLLLLVPFILLLIFWDQFPDEVPIHWNIRGETDDFAPKMPGMLLMPLVAIFVQLVFWLIPVLDPKRRVEQFISTMLTLQVMFGFLFLGLFLIILLSVLGKIDDPTSLVLPALVLALAFMGNFFGKLRPNYFIGIRTHWTLESEDNWKKTHRLGARVWVITSLILLVIFPFVEGEQYLITFVVGLAIMSLLPIGYSFWLFQQGKAKNGA